MTITNETATITTAADDQVQSPLNDEEQSLARRVFRTQAETFIAGLRRYPDLLQELIELLGSRPELSLMFFGVGPISSNGASPQQVERLTVIFSQPQVINTLVVALEQHDDFKMFINTQVSHALNAARSEAAELRKQLDEQSRYIDRLNGASIDFKTEPYELWTPSSRLRRVTSLLAGIGVGLVVGVIYWSYTHWWPIALLIVLCGLACGIFVGRGGTIVTREVVVGGSIVYPELVPATSSNNSEVTA